MMIGNTTLGLFNSGLPSFPILGAPRYRNNLAHFSYRYNRMTTFQPYLFVWVYECNCRQQKVTLSICHVNKGAEEQGNGQRFRGPGLSSALHFFKFISRYFLFLGCLQIAVSSFGEEDQHLGATAACVSELPARRLRCNLALSAVLPLCNFVFFALLSHVHTCLCAHAQHCHVFNRDL